jgi:hypothetical protein
VRCSIAPQLGVEACLRPDGIQPAIRAPRLDAGRDAHRNPYPYGRLDAVVVAITRKPGDADVLSRRLPLGIDIEGRLLLQDTRNGVVEVEQTNEINMRMLEPLSGCN